MSTTMSIPLQSLPVGDTMPNPYGVDALTDTSSEGSNENPENPKSISLDEVKM